MLTQSQNDPRWKKLVMGKVVPGKISPTIGFFGCLEVVLASILNRNPGDVLAFLNKNNCFDAQGKLDTERACKLLGFTSYEVVDHDPHQLCVVEVDYSPAVGIQSHFMGWLGDGTKKVMNPWPYPAVIEVNEWPVVNWRVLGIPKPKPLPAAASTPSRPPEPDKPPQVAAQAKYAELVKQDVLASLPAQESLWQRFQTWFRRLIWPRDTLAT